MYIRSNIHTHTDWSDGKDPMESVIATAVEKGFHTIGISDHAYVPFCSQWSLKAGQESAYMAEMRRLREKFAGKIDVLCGIEYGYEGESPELDYDYFIGSLHSLKINGADYEVDHDPAHFQALLDCCHGDSLEVAKRYYNDLAEFTLKCRPTVLGHFDLLTKFSMVELSDAYWYCAEEAMKAVLPAVQVVEVNTGAMSRGWRDEAYPDDQVLKLVLQLGGKIILSSDSHQACHLDYAFPETLERLRRVGFTIVYEMTKNGFVDVKL